MLGHYLVEDGLLGLMPLICCRGTFARAQGVRRVLGANRIRGARGWLSHTSARRSERLARQHFSISSLKLMASVPLCSPMGPCVLQGHGARGAW
jgi:hypothetical protein